MSLRPGFFVSPGCRALSAQGRMNSPEEQQSGRPMASPKQHPDEKLRNPSAPRTSDTRWAIWWFGAHVQVGDIHLSGVRASDDKGRTLGLVTREDRLDATLTSPEGIQTVSAQTATPAQVASEFETEWRSLFDGDVRYDKPAAKKRTSSGDSRGKPSKKAPRNRKKGKPKGGERRHQKPREDRRGATNSLGDLAPELFEQLKKKS